MTPYRISGPAQIAFSGGRTSAYLLHQILEANGGMPADCHVSFQNTGKERIETLDFVEECAQRWGVKINWCEFTSLIPGSGSVEWRYVDRATASTKGEPFAKLIEQKNYLPNVTQRICTAYLKVKVGTAFMKSLGYEDWDSVIGIRADEPRRVARMRAPGRDNREGIPLLPLATANVSKAMVLDFWKRQPFNLQLDPEGDLGNCDLCFLKARHKLVRAIREDKNAPVWWIEQERKVGAQFIKGYLSYTDMVREADFWDRQPDFFEEESLVDCMCGD